MGGVGVWLRVLRCCFWQDWVGMGYYGEHPAQIAADTSRFGRDVSFVCVTLKQGWWEEEGLVAEIICITCTWLVGGFRGACRWESM
jgi:hypothetical protein